MVQLQIDLGGAGGEERSMNGGQSNLDMALDKLAILRSKETWWGRNSSQRTCAQSSQEGPWPTLWKDRQPHLCRQEAKTSCNSLPFGWDAECLSCPKPPLLHTMCIAICLSAHPAGFQRVSRANLDSCCVLYLARGGILISFLDWNYLHVDEFSYFE